MMGANAPGYMDKWRAENKERIKVWRRAYYKRNRDRQLLQATEWQKTNPERFAMQYRASSANRRYAGRLTTDDIQEVIDRSGRICHWCQRPNLSGRHLTIEHLKPINDKRYVVVACLPCNAARIHLYGPRKSEEQKRREAVARSQRWVEANRERVRTYHREYARKRRAVKRAERAA